MIEKMSEKIKELRKDTEKAAKYFEKILAYTLGPVELKSLMDRDNVKIIDVRAKSDYDISHIPGAISVPKDEIKDRKDEFSKEETHVVYCYNQQCHLGARACLEFAELCLPVMHMEGGFKTWTEDFHFAVTSET